MKSSAFAIASLSCLVLSGATATAAWLCPFCDAPSLSMAEQLQMSDHVLLGKWLGGDKPTETKAGSSQFRIVQVSKSVGQRFAVGQTIELPQYIAGDKAALYSLMGPDAQLLDWQVPTQISQSGWDYLSQIPAPVTDPEAQTERLAFAIEFLEHPDLMISNDAYAEFAAAPYEVITPLKDRLPREKLRQWLMDPKTSATRIGLYGLLLGLCGTDDDAAAMEQKIVVPDTDFRLGIEGVMSGYLLIRGEAGLKVLEDTKMLSKTCRNPEGEEIKLPFSETYASMQALRFMWTYEPDRLPKDRLKQSMRLLLPRVEMTDLVIADLARWKDWDVQDQLMEMYDDPKFNIPAIKRAIVKFLYYCSQDKPAVADGQDPVNPPHAVKAAAHLAELEKKDPKTVSDAKRYLIR
ncbi:MAG: hypothetical protein KDA91_07320 [Planctomycetaceae bacterium]|nr:hypothetical protein [Planctomycetaceae bacterium]